MQIEQPFIRNRPYLHFSTPTISPALPRNNTLSRTELDTVSKEKLFNTSLADSLSLLQATAENILVQEVIGIICDSNFYGKLFTSKISSVQKRYEVSGRIASVSVANTSSQKYTKPLGYLHLCFNSKKEINKLQSPFYVHSYPPVFIRIPPPHQFHTFCRLFVVD